MWQGIGRYHRRQYKIHSRPIIQLITLVCEFSLQSNLIRAEEKATTDNYGKCIMLEREDRAIVGRAV